MLRAVLAALLAVALVGVATTALDRTRESRADRLADAEAADLVDAATDLRGSERAVVRAGDAARRVVEVALPDGDPTTAPVEYVSLGGVPGRDLPGDTDRRDVVAYRVHGGRPRLRWLPVDLRIPGPRGPRPDRRALVVREPTRVVLSLVRRAGRDVVLARRW